MQQLQKAMLVAEYDAGLDFIEVQYNPGEFSLEKGAQIAEAQNQAETKQRQAEAMQIAEVSKAQADIAVAAGRRWIGRLGSGQKDR